MWRNRFVLVLIITMSVAALFPLTRSAPSSVQASSPPADVVGHFSLVPMNFEYQNTKISTLVRIDNQTGQAWFVRVIGVQGQPVWEWTDLPEAGTKPKP